MRTLAEKPAVPHQAISATITGSNQTRFDQSRAVNLTYRPQSAVGNCVAQRLPWTRSESLANEPNIQGTTRFGYDFSQIPVRSSAYKGIQTKLMIDTPGDQYEQEADQVAKQVMSMPRPQLQRAKCACDGEIEPSGECEKCKAGRQRVQRQAHSDITITAVPPIVQEVIRRTGQPLDTATQSFMELRFAQDFSSVRVHSDALAAASAQAVNARAFTLGQHIVFGAGQYSPLTPAGRQLMAHELTHVVQQAGSGTKASSTVQPDQLQQNAQPVAVSAADNSAQISIRAAAAPRIARSPGPGDGDVPKLRSHGLAPAEIKLLNEVRGRLVPASERSTAIVGVLISDDGRQFEFRSGGGQGFSSHIEGKATAKMEELGLKKAVLLVEKEPCQICDRSVYPGDTGPETPLKSSKTGKEISRQTPKINTALSVGSELTVVDPDSASLYRGVKSSPAAPIKPPSSGGGKQPGASKPEGGSAAKPKGGTGAVEGGPTPSAPGTSPKAGSGVSAVPKAGATPKPLLPGGAGAAGGATSSEIRAVARAAARELATDFKLLRVAKGLNAALNIVGFIAALATLDGFAKMTVSGLAGKGFILTKEIAEAEKLDTEASVLKRDYMPFSGKLTEKWPAFIKAASDPLAAGQAASSISELDTNLQQLKRDLPEQIGRINAALKEAEAKRKAAEAILNDPKASAAIAMATFSTAALAELFAASQDLQRIASALSSASNNLTQVQNQVSEDYIYINGWFEALFQVCRKGGYCSLSVLTIPFVGSSSIYSLPGEAD